MGVDGNVINFSVFTVEALHSKFPDSSLTEGEQLCYESGL